VRNAFEHIDERLDRLLAESPSARLVQFHLTRHPPPEGLVLKRFDPVGLAISYLDQRLELEACYSEIKMVEEHVKNTHEHVRKSGGLLGGDAIA